MNWIEKMIAEQCPNGVKKVKLGEVCEKITDGSHNLPPTVEFSDFRMISSQNIYNTRLDFHGIRYLEKEGYEKENKRTYVEKDNVLLTIVGAIGRCYVVKKEDLPFTCQRSVCVIKLNKDKYNPYFLHECIIGMSSTLERQANGAAQKGLYLKQVAQIEIPLPPLSIQKEIVSVLDKFSELIEKTDEEIALRQKQYEYYREKLLTFEEGEVEWKKLGDVALIGTGSRNTQDGMNVGQYPFYTRGQEILRLDEYDYNETAIITAGDGAGVGKTFHFVKGCYALHQRAYRFVANEQIISPKFLYNYIKQTFYDYIMRNSVFGSVPSVRKPMLEKYLIPIPSLSRQQDIVATLDKFETLISKLKEERELRQKQYEYYREKLLTF